MSDMILELAERSRRNGVHEFGLNAGRLIYGDACVMQQGLVRLNCAIVHCMHTLLLRFQVHALES